MDLMMDCIQNSLSLTKALGNIMPTHLIKAFEAARNNLRQKLSAYTKGQWQKQHRIRARDEEEEDAEDKVKHVKRRRKATMRQVDKTANATRHMADEDEENKMEELWALSHRDPLLRERYVPLNPFEEYKNVYYINEEGWEKDRDIIYEIELVQVPKGVPGTTKRWKKCEEEDGKIHHSMEKRWKVTLTADPTTHYLVAYDSYKRVTFSPDNYQAEQSFSDDKHRVNHRFTDLLRAHQREDRHVVYLDSPLCLTTKTLWADGFNKDQLSVPNPDKSFLAQCPAWFNKRASHYDATLYEWMRDLDDLDGDEYDVGADYCCQFNGNTQCRPKADLTLMFQKGLFAKRNGVLWLTLSKRSRVKGQTMDKTSEEVMDFVTATGAHFGYNMTCVEAGDYGTVLYFFFVSK